jgi:hypothetical protein
MPTTFTYEHAVKVARRHVVNKRRMTLTKQMSYLGAVASSKGLLGIVLFVVIVVVVVAADQKEIKAIIDELNTDRVSLASSRKATMKRHGIPFYGCLLFIIY